MPPERTQLPRARRLYAGVHRAGLNDTHATAFTSEPSFQTLDASAGCGSGGVCGLPPGIWKPVLRGVLGR